MISRFDAPKQSVRISGELRGNKTRLDERKSGDKELTRTSPRRINESRMSLKRKEVKTNSRRDQKKRKRRESN